MKNYRPNPQNPPRLSKTDLARLDRMTDYSDIPPLGEEFFATATRPLVPNRETIEAMKAAERGNVTTAGPPGNLIKSLHEDADPWLLAMLDDVYRQLGGMIEMRGDGEFSPGDEARYWALVREVEEIEKAMRRSGKAR